MIELTWNKTSTEIGFQSSFNWLFWSKFVVRFYIAASNFQLMFLGPHNAGRFEPAQIILNHSILIKNRVNSSKMIEINPFCNFWFFINNIVVGFFLSLNCIFTKNRSILIKIGWITVNLIEKWLKSIRFHHRPLIEVWFHCLISNWTDFDVRI